MINTLTRTVSKNSTTQRDVTPWDQIADLIRCHIGRDPTVNRSPVGRR